MTRRRVMNLLTALPLPEFSWEETEPGKIRCPRCGRVVSMLADGRIRGHRPQATNKLKGAPCSGSGLRL